MRTDVVWHFLEGSVVFVSGFLVGDRRPVRLAAYDALNRKLLTVLNSMIADATCFREAQPS